MTVRIAYDEPLIFEIAAKFDLREPNRRSLEAVVKAVELAGASFTEVVADLATGVGKTFLLAALVEYLATQGVRHVLVVTPGSTIQRKTLSNFDAASGKYVPGADMMPTIITPDNFQSASVGTVLRDPTRLKVFVFNVQQLIRPTDRVSRRVRGEDENLGDALYAYLERAEDLFVIADEHHVYHERANAFSAAIRDLTPVALIGLTATPDRTDIPKIVFQYTLGEAIADGHVKVPVIVYRKDGTKDERTQLRDACHLLTQKEAAYEQYRSLQSSDEAVRPVLFVVCQSIDHSSEVGQLLSQDGYIGDPKAVLEVTSESSDEALQALADVEKPGSPIRAVVSVNMLREGWDVKNIAVIVALRRLASQMLTEQILGRGLRLPFGRRTGLPTVDQVDLVAHDSYRQLLDQKNVLRQRLQMPPAEVEVDEHGAAVATEPDSSKTSSRQGSDAEAATQIPGQATLFDGIDDDEDTTDNKGESADPAILLRETEKRIAAPQPKPMGRTDGAPLITFPRRESRLAYSAFSLSDLPDGDAQVAGARFIREVPTFIYRDALEAKRHGDDVTITVSPQESEQAQQTLAGLDVVREDLITAIMQQPEVPRDRTTKNAARRLVRAFLKGAGVTSEEASAEWGQTRQRQAVEGMRILIRGAIYGSRISLYIADRGYLV